MDVSIIVRKETRRIESSWILAMFASTYPIPSTSASRLCTDKVKLFVMSNISSRCGRLVHYKFFQQSSKSWRWNRCISMFMFSHGLDFVNATAIETWQCPYSEYWGPMPNNESRSLNVCDLLPHGQVLSRGISHRTCEFLDFQVCLLTRSNC